MTKEQCPKCGSMELCYVINGSLKIVCAKCGASIEGQPGASNPEKGEGVNV